MDKIDKQILRSLASNSRMSLKALAGRVGLAAPTTSDRLKRLEERGEILRYTIDVDPQRLGYGVVAMVRINPQPGKLRIVERLINATSAIIECDKVTGEDCYFPRVCIKSLQDVDAVLEQFHDHAQTVTCIVKSQTIKRRLPPL